MTKLGWKKGEGIGAKPSTKADEPLGTKVRNNPRRQGLKSSTKTSEKDAPLCLRGTVGRVEWALDDVLQLLTERSGSMSAEAEGTLRRGHHRLVKDVKAASRTQGKERIRLVQQSASAYWTR